jgi:hypothetical protein
MSMLGRAQAIFLRLTVQAERAAAIREIRSFFVGAAHRLRTVADAKEAIVRLAGQMAAHQEEVESWVSPDAIARGEGGPFDGADLRHWLALAERANVPAIPARTIASFTEDEYSAISGEQALPDNAVMRSLKGVLGRAAAELTTETSTDAGARDEGTPKTGLLADDREMDREALYDRLADAMDDVPEGWMVRCQRSGGSELKSLAGFGIMDDTAPEVRFGPDLEVGPGWIRQGNRRRINHADQRTLDSIAHGPGEAVFLARPWVKASRYLECEDPHRHGTPFAGKGFWPAEWRAIVDGNVVRGVASYYGWADSPTPHSARIALRVRDLAQRIVDEAVAQRAWPRAWEIERRRDEPTLDSVPGLVEALPTRWGRETVACTIDFIETDDGPIVLEAGPAVSPFGPGHPCAAAGRVSARCRVHQFEGVAFRVPSDVILADPATWDGDHPDIEDAHWSWERVEALAAQA